MFSTRIPWSARPNALTRALAGSGPPAIDLTTSNPTRVALAYPDDALRSALARAATVRYAPDPRGLRSAREAVAQYYATEHGIAVNPDHIVLTASSSESYAFLFKLLADPGDFVRVPRPSYPLFEHLAGLEGVRTLPFDYGYDGAWHLAPAAFVNHARDTRVRAIVVVHPNNPTGAFAKRAERNTLHDQCTREGAVLVSDEVFADYAFAPDDARAPSFAGETEVPTAVLGGLSKCVGLPGVKLGWIVLAGPTTWIESAMSRLELVSDTWLSVGASVQAAAPELLRIGASVRDAIRARTCANLETARDLLDAREGSACSALRVEGGWSLPVRLPATRDDEAWAITLLERDGVLTQPGYFYDMDAGTHLVLSLLVEPAAFRAGLLALAQRVRADV